MLYLITVSNANLYLQDDAPRWRVKIYLENGDSFSVTVSNPSANGNHICDLSRLEFQLKMQIWNINYEYSPINKSLGILSDVLYIKKILRILHFLEFIEFSGWTS